MDINMEDLRSPIPGYRGLYEIDLAGNVYAMFEHRGMKAGWKKTTRLTSYGYRTVTLLTKSRTIHRLLMLTWNPIEGCENLEVNHIDGNKDNNDLSNLEWVTHAENLHHASQIKAWVKSPNRGARVVTAKLTDDDVREIRRQHMAGIPRKDTAAQFGITPSNIWYIVERKSWTHI